MEVLSKGVISIPNCLSRATEQDLNKFDIILNSIGSIYANGDLLKCICDEKDQNIEFTKCSNRILNEIIFRDLKSNDSFVRLLANSIKTYHFSHLCSTKTAICLTIILSKRTMSSLNESRLNSKTMSKFLKIVLDRSIELIKKNSQFMMSLKKSENKSRFISRHFCDEKKFNYNFAANENFFHEFLFCLFRQNRMMSLVCWQLLKKYEKYDASNLKFENIKILSNASTSKNQLTTDISSSNEFNFRVKRGIVLNIDFQNYQAMLKLSNENSFLNSLIFDSSLVHDYAHLGFNKNLKYEKIKASLDNQASNAYFETWSSKVKKILLDSNIKLLFVRDRVEQSLAEFCQEKSILLFKNFELNVFDSLKYYFKTNCLIYIESFNKDNIFQVEVSLLKNLSKSEFKNLKNNYIQLKCPNNVSSPIFTIIIETRLPYAKAMYEECLKHCLKRLLNVLIDGVYLKGAGFIEKFLSEKIVELKMPGNANDHESIYFDLAKEILSVTFKDIYLMIVNNQNFACDVIDDYTSKLEAWKMANAINNIYLNSDLSVLI